MEGVVGMGREGREQVGSGTEEGRAGSGAGARAWREQNRGMAGAGLGHGGRVAGAGLSDHPAENGYPPVFRAEESPDGEEESNPTSVKLFLVQATSLTARSHAYSHFHSIRKSRITLEPINGAEPVFPERTTILSP